MRAFGEEMLNYAMCNRKRFTNVQKRIQHHWLHGVGVESDSDIEQHGEGGQKVRRGYTQLKNAGERFLAVWNGPLWECPDCVHYQPAGCTRSREEVAEEMARSAQDFLFHAAPTVPSANKWTKLGPCCDWLAMALCAHGLLAGVFAQLKEPKAEVSLQQDLRDLDQDLRKDVAFSAVAGSRFNASKDFLAKRETPFTMVILCVVLEPLRALSVAWMKAASDVEDPCRPPRLMDMVNPAHSAIRHAMQYLATLLSGNASRLIFLWRLAGCASLDAWYTQRPDQVCVVRRLCLLISCWPYRRHHCQWQDFPWLLVGVADQRRSLANRRELAHKFFTTLIAVYGQAWLAACALWPG